MVLAKYSERFGMTLSNLLSILSLLIVLVGFIITSQVRMAQIETNIKALDVKYNIRYEYLESGRLNNAAGIEQNRKENREEHQELSNKLDKIIERI